MKDFFHWDPAPLKRRRKKMLFCAAALCTEVCIAAFFILIFNICTAPDYGVIFQMLAVICVTLLAGMLFCLITELVCDKKIRRKSRFTYIDIQLKALVYSSYAGDWRVAGERISVRDIYCVPFRELSSVSVDPDGRAVTVTGKLRHYCMNSENLGYRVKNGDFEFDRPYLNIGGFTVEEKVRIPAVFGSAKRVADSLERAKKRFDELPAPRPYVFREADHIRKRPKARVMPESFDYSRNWKD